MVMTTLTTEKVLDFCEEYCAVLRSKMIQWRINLHRESIGKGDNDKYHLEKIDGLVNGTDPNIPEYQIQTGKKYARIVMNDGGRSVHAFVNLSNGDVYKPASWQAPVKDARYNLMLEDARAVLFNSVDPFGSYLYKR
jgi:hypothetical protein